MAPLRLDWPLLPPSGGKENLHRSDDSSRFSTINMKGYRTDRQTGPVTLLSWESDVHVMRGRAVPQVLQI